MVFFYFGSSGNSETRHLTNYQILAINGLVSRYYMLHVMEGFLKNGPGFQGFRLSRFLGGFSYFSGFFVF